MKYLALKIADIDGKNALYDFNDDDSELTAEEVLGYIEDVLFGNDAHFSGVAELTLEKDGKTYTVHRDFSGSATVEKDGEVLSESESAAIIDSLSSVGRKQWKDNNIPCDAELFSQDPAEYVTKFLSNMGFDSEELETRSDADLKKADRLATKNEALAELSSPGAKETAENIAEELAALKAENAELAQSEEVYNKNAAISDKISLVQSELDEVMSHGDEISEKREKLALNEKIVEKSEAAKKSEELQKAKEELRIEVDKLTEELDELQSKCNEATEKSAQKEAEFRRLAEEEETLRSEFRRMLAENAEKGEITEYTVDRIPENTETGEALRTFMELDERFLDLTKQLGEKRYGYLKKRSIREGVAFESALDDKKDRLNTINSVLAAQNDTVAALEEEIRQSKELLASADGVTLAAADSIRLALHEKIVNVRLLKTDVDAIKAKVTEIEETLSKIDEDIAAITEAKKGAAKILNDSIEERAELQKRISAAKARLDLSKEVEDLEYGAICPVCRGIIADKAPIINDNRKLRPLLERLIEAKEEKEALIREYLAKLEKIEGRMGQLNERKALCNNFLKSLIETLSAKETAQSTILTEAGVMTLPALERRAGDCDAKFHDMCSIGDGEYVARHIAYLESQTAFFKEKIAPLTEQAGALEREIAEMGGAYNDEILPSLEGRTAYSYLDEIVASEETEDNLLKDLINTDELRAEALEKYLEAERDGKGDIITATSSVINEAFEDIRNAEDAAKAAYDAWMDNAEIEEYNAKISEKATKASALLSEAEKINGEIEELAPLANSPVEGEPLDKEESEKLAAEIAEYDEKTAALNAQLTTLNSLKTVAEYDAERHEAVKKSIVEKEAELATVKEKAAISLAAQEIIARNNAEIESLKGKSEILRMLADGEISEVIMPILNDVLVQCGEEAIASSDGYGLKFTLEGRKKTRTMSAESVDDDGNLSTAVDCALNYVLRVASDSNATRFVLNREIPEQVAEKYGLVTIK